MNEMGSGESESESEPESPPPKKKAKRSGGGGGGGLAAKKEISPELAKFLNVGEGTMMARTEIVKMLWDYIREHDLQNPSDKREVVLDEAMQAVFGCEKFTMFTMNKVSALCSPLVYCLHAVWGTYCLI